MHLLLVKCQPQDYFSIQQQCNTGFDYYYFPLGWSKRWLTQLLFVVGIVVVDGGVDEGRDSVDAK